MKLDRMLSIVTCLLNHEKVKAKELAEKFEVSVRTIYRDIDAISQAGIPITAYQGADGGIGIIEGFKLDKNLLTGNEVHNIVAGLKGIQSISEDVKIKLLIEKLTTLASKSDYIPTGNEILIDLSSWNKNDKLRLRIQEIKKAIRERKIIEFLYVKGDEVNIPIPCVRKVEPYVIVFKEINWYLYAYCLLRQEFRLFKLRRMNGVKLTDGGFEARDYTLDKVNWDEEYDKDRHSTIVLLFDKSMEYSASDIFGTENFEIAGDGRLKVTFQMEISSWLYGFLLSFGDKIEVLEPVELRVKINNMAESVCKLYKNKKKHLV
jgi:predicted DNA-binding transcriptional regulator YafY